MYLLSVWRVDEKTAFPRVTVHSSVSRITYEPDETRLWSFLQSTQKWRDPFGAAKTIGEAHSFYAGLYAF